jgi:hypothetical protein
MRRTAIWLGIFLLLTVVVPIAAGAALAFSRGWADSWRTADWSSSRLLADPTATPEAKVLILAARTGQWKSIFAEHTAIVFKPQGAKNWTRYEVVGWGDPVRRNGYAPDALWYGNTPYVAAEISGPEAESLIPKIMDSILRYPCDKPEDYTVWPGPNSNSFVAWVVRHTKDFNVELPPAAVGKDYMGSGLFVDRAPSGTGVTVSLSGVLGITLAMREGLELNLMGVVIGLDPEELAIKLPSLGKLSLLDLF